MININLYYNYYNNYYNYFSLANDSDEFRMFTISDVVLSNLPE